VTLAPRVDLGLGEVDAPCTLDYSRKLPEECWALVPYLYRYGDFRRPELRKFDECVAGEHPWPPGVLEGLQQAAELLKRCEPHLEMFRALYGNDPEASYLKRLEFLFDELEESGWSESEECDE
jgi:hypothetical protein